MNWQFTPFLIPTILSAGVAGAIALFAGRRRHSPGALQLQVLMAAIAVWCFGYAWELAAAELSGKNFGALIKYLGVVLVSPAFLLFALKYSGKEGWLSHRLLWFLAIEPILFLLLSWTNEYHGLIWPSVRLEDLGPYKARITSHGGVFYIHTCYAYATLTLGAFLMVRATFHRDSLFRGQGIYVVIAVLAPILANILYLTRLNPFRPFDLTPFSFVITGASLAFSIFRFQLLNIVPIAHDKVIRSMQDGFIALDNRDRIVEMNPAAQKITGVNDLKYIGKRNAEVFSSWPDFLGLCRQSSPDNPSFLAGPPGSQRFYEVQILSLQRDRESPAGRLLVLHDMTDRKRTEEVLQQAQSDLERRVEERTREIKVANHRLQEEIQERRKTQAILIESEAMYRQLVEQPFDGVYVHRGGNIIYINKTALRLLGGTSQDQFLGHSILEFISPEYKDFVAQRIRAISEGAREVPLVEEKFIRLDGKVIDVEVAGSILMYEGLASVMVIFRDISGRRQALLALEESEQKYRNLVNDTPGLVCRFLPDGTLTFVNRSYADYFQRKPEELVGQNFFQFIPEGERETVRQAYLALGPGKPITTYEHPVTTTDGKIRWHQWTDRVILDDQGRVMEYQSLGLDVTTQHEAKMTLQKIHEELERRVRERTDELQRANWNLEIEIVERKRVEKELRKARDFAESASRAKSDFLATMSHELRTPLNHIIGFTEMVVDQQFGPLSEIQEEYLNDVLESSRHLLSLINDILDLAKVEAGKMTLEVEPVPLQALLEGSLVMVQEKALKHRITLTTEWKNLPEWVEGDGRKLKQIMFNLLSNAVKFTPDGGQVTVKASPVSFPAGGRGRKDLRPLPAPTPDNGGQAKSDEGLLVSIEDTGIGIRKEDLERIFKPFEQVASPLNRRHNGTGLGLPLSQRMIELHGGWIWAESDGPDKGSAFRFVIPNHPIIQEGRDLWNQKPS